jgi:hypothetical protein
MALPSFAEVHCGMGGCGRARLKGHVTSLTGLRVARELDRIAELRNYPCMIV